MRLKALLSIIVLLLVGILFAGCTGGGSSLTDEQQINNVLNQYELAMKTKDAEKLAGLASYPLYMDG